MKQKSLRLLVAAIVVLGCIFLGKSLVGSKPFDDLHVREIQEITVRLTPPGLTLAVDDTECASMVEALNAVVLYGKDRSTEPLAEQAVVFTITKTDGTVVVVEPLGNLTVVDGVRYHAKSAPNAKLSDLANQLNSLKEGG